MNMIAAVRTVGIILGILFSVFIPIVIAIGYSVYFESTVTFIIFLALVILGFFLRLFCWTDIQGIYRSFSGDTK